MEYRIEHDTMGEVRVPAEHFWGAQTERSLENFRIGTETIPREVIHAFAVLKSAAATANHALGKLPEAEAQAITDACRDICDGKYPEEFPLKVWQTGSGTQSNMNMNEVIACIMTNWIAANLVTWMFDISNFKNMVENTKSGYIYKTSFNGVATPKLGLDKLFPGSQINGGILLAILLAVVVYVIMQKTTFGYQLKACGSNRHAARYAGIPDKRNIVLSMAIAGALAGTGAALYWLSGNTEFYWTTYQSLPAVGFNGIPVALLAINNPVGVIFAGIFMAMLDIVGMQLTNLTAYNEYITDVIISVIVYLSAFSLVIRMMLVNIRKRREMKKATVTTAPVPPEAQAQPLDAPEETPPDPDGEQEKGGEDA